MRRILPWAMSVVAGLTSCKDIDRFSTDAGESYCGKIVSATIVRLGFSEKACMRMTFDARHVNDQPGVVWMNDGMFDGAALRPIPQLSHDPLLTFTFGEGREKNFLFSVDPADPARGPALTAVVSLMHSGDAEVRLLRGAAGGTSPSPDGGASVDGAPLFGVFAPLRRQRGACREEPDCGWLPEAN